VPYIRDESRKFGREVIGMREPPEEVPERSPGQEAPDEPFLERQRQRLLGLRAALLETRHRLEADEREWMAGSRAEPLHNEDVNAHLLSEELDAALEWRIDRRLANIERALAKIDEGTYGICDATGETIPRGRLEAVPEAIYTIEAQRKLER
jgi:DnaK suppressor protein